MGKLKSAADLITLREDLLKKQPPDQAVVRVCLGPGCLALGAE
jgi:hypothetical protein